MSRIEDNRLDIVIWFGRRVLVVGLLIALIFAFAFSVEGALTDDLIAYYSFDSNATDDHGSNDGTLVGNTARVGSCQLGGCYYFDGADDWINFGDWFGNIQAGEFAVQAWINLTAAGANPIAFYQGDTDYKPMITLQWVNSQTKYYFDVRDASTGENANYNTGGSVDNVYEHWIIQKNSTHLQMFLDGALVADVASTRDIGDFISLQARIGADAAGNSDYPGQVDEVGIWNRSLTQDEITSLYNSGVGLAYPFSTGSGPVLQNSTWNLTTASGGNSTVWRTDQTVAIPTRDTTPTLTVNTDIAAWCRIGVADSNWTVMNSSRECSTSGTTSHVCSLSAQDAFVSGSGYNSLYVACTNIDNVTMSALSTSGSLNVSLDLYLMNGTTKNDDGGIISGAVVSIIDQSGAGMYANTTSNSSGGWSINAYSSNWTVVAYDPNNISVDADCESWVEVK